MSLPARARRPGSPPLSRFTPSDGTKLFSADLQQVVHEQNDAVRREKERRSLELLQRPQAKYDIDHALILCQMNNFKDGILYLYGKAQLYQVKLRKESYKSPILSLH